MSSADWEEVKRLAADFQRAQLTSASQRLTERNCIEIVNRLIELKLLDVVYTSDGKEYITPQQLVKEIQDELYVHGGRLSLVTLASNLNVSLSVVEARVADLLKQDRRIHNVLGQLITATFIDTMCEDLNEKLVQDGMVSLSELSKTSDLPGEFLQDQIEKRLGKVIHGKVDRDDPNLIYTETFVRRNTARIRGILSAITKPTPINQILLKFGSNVPEKLFFGIVDKLITTKRIEGIVSGGGSSRSAYYIPSAHTKAQVQWIEGFMNGNGYVDLDAAARLGISDPKSFITKRFPNQHLLFLKTCVLGERLFKQAKEQVEESLSSPGWVDITSILPASVTEQDLQILMDEILAGVKNTTVFDSIVVNKSLLEELKKQFKPLMPDKAAKDISSGKYIQLVNDTRAAEKKLKLAELGEDSTRSGGKKDDRRKKAASGKAGGGTQGRETKTKATKKKYLAGKKDDWSDSEDDNPPPSITLSNSASSKASSRAAPTANKNKVQQQLEFQSVNEVRYAIAKNESLSEAPLELLESIAQIISVGLQDEYQVVLKEAFDKFMSEKCGRKSQEEVLEKLFKMTTMFQLYVEGLNSFEGDVKNQLEKFLLKSFGQEIVIAATTFLLMEAGLDENSQVGDLPEGKVKQSMLALGKSADIETFTGLLQTVVPPVKKSAKSTFNPRNILLESRDSLMKELGVAETSDPALFLHIASLILFSLTSEALLQASGKFVPQIISSLSGKLTKEEHAQMKECQEQVVSLIKLKNGPGAEEAKEHLTTTILPSIKNIITNRTK